MAQSDWVVVGAAGPPPVVGAVQAPLSPQIEEEVGQALPPPTAVAGLPGTEGALPPSTLVAAAAA